MKKHLVRVVVAIFMAVSMTAKSATILWFAGPGYTSGGNTYSITGPVTVETSGLTNNNIGFTFSGPAGGSIYLRTANVGNPWVVGQTYRSTDALGGYLQILLNTPYRDSFSSTSYWEFTVHQAVIDVIPDKFAASGKIVDSIGKETSFYVQYNSTAIPEPTIAFVAPLGLLTLLRRRRS